MFVFFCLVGVLICMWGGGSRRGWLDFSVGYSEEAQCIGNRLEGTAYLEPNRITVQKPKRGRSVFALLQAIKMLKHKETAN